MAEEISRVTEHAPYDRPLPKDAEKCASSTNRCVAHSDSTSDTREGKAETTGIGVTDVVWDNGCTFRMHADAANPLVEAAEPVTYAANVTVTPDGAVQLTGVHDGFPCFEWYAQTDFGPFRTLYTYDYRDAGGSPLDLAGPPTCEFTVSDDG